MTNLELRDFCIRRVAESLGIPPDILAGLDGNYSGYRAEIEQFTGEKPVEEKSREIAKITRN